MSDNRENKVTPMLPGMNLRTEQHSLKAAPPAILPSYPNERSLHVMADEIIWEQYILEKTPLQGYRKPFF